jgi:hypothetical protein
MRMQKETGASSLWRCATAALAQCKHLPAHSPKHNSYCLQSSPTKEELQTMHQQQLRWATHAFARLMNMNECIDKAV